MQDSEVREGPLTIRVKQSGSTRRLELGGELELSTAPAFSTQLEQAISDGTETVVVDMSRLEFLDSTGIALLVEAHKRLNRDDEDRFVLVPSEALAVKRVMEVTGLNDQFRFLDGSGR